MSDFNYKEYSLEKLKDWVYDALDNASPHEIYSTIRDVVQEQHNYYKENAQKCFGLLELLSGHRPVNLQPKDDGMRPWGHSDLEYLIANKKQDKVRKWVLPTEVDGLTGDVFVNFPDDLLEAADLKEGDQVEWIDRGDGSYLLKKVTQPLGSDEC
jgi:hypothetical protein